MHKVVCNLYKTVHAYAKYAIVMYYSMLLCKTQGKALG